MAAAERFPYFDTPFAAYAHRGGATYPPNLHRENTLHAFEQAVALGYRYLETDVHVTADGVLLAFHDSVLERVTDRPGAIARLSAAEVSQAKIHGLDPIPTLADLLVRFPYVRFNIDCKADEAVEPLARTLREHGALDRVCVSSFGIRRLHRLRKLLGPQVPSAASSVGIVVNRFTPWITAVLNTPAPVLQIPITQQTRFGVLQVLTPGLIRAVHRAGKRVQLWTIDSAPEMERLIDLGVDGIFTDRIDTLKSVLQSRGLWD